MGKKEKKPYKRRNYFVKKAFQLSFIFRFFILGLFFSFIVNVFMYFLLGSRIEETLFSAHITVKTVGDIVIPYLVFINIIVVVLVAIFSAVLIKSFHKKVSGPLFRFQKLMDGIAQGDLLSNVKLRKGDQLVEIQDRFNFMLDCLREKINGVKSSFISTQKDIKEIDELTAGKDINVQEVKQRTSQLFENLEKLDMRIKNFKS